MKIDYEGLMVKLLPGGIQRGDLRKLRMFPVWDREGSLLYYKCDAVTFVPCMKIEREGVSEWLTDGSRSRLNMNAPSQVCMILDYNWVSNLFIVMFEEKHYLTGLEEIIGKTVDFRTTTNL